MPELSLEGEVFLEPHTAVGPSARDVPRPLGVAGRAAKCPLAKARAAKRCAACGGHLRGDDHAVKQAGDALHAACALYRPPRPLLGQRKVT